MKPNIKDGESRAGRRNKIRGFFLQIIRPPVCHGHRFSQINTDFNGILENYYDSTCSPAVNNFFLNSQLLKKNNFFLKCCRHWYDRYKLRVAANLKNKLTSADPPKCFFPPQKIPTFQFTLNSASFSVLCNAI